jgi:hypothetical protein
MGGLANMVAFATKTMQALGLHASGHQCLAPAFTEVEIVGAATVGIDPDVGTAATTSRINETIGGAVFDRWRTDASYSPEKARRSVMATSRGHYGT